MAQIIIEIPDRVYEALDKARRANTAPRQSPNNPEAVIIEPVFSSNEAWIQAIVDGGLAPIAAQVPTAEQQALAEEIARKKAELEALSKPTVSVLRQ